MDENTIYYVYMYLRTYNSKHGCAGSPYYVGKGKGMRAWSINHRVRPPDPSNIVFVSRDMNEADAFQLEVYLIHLYGRIDLGTGCLRNLTDGGDTKSGFICSLETRKKISESHLRLKKHLTLSQRQNLREVNTGRYPSASTRAKLCLRTHETSDATREKIREKSKHHSPESKAKAVATRRLSDNFSCSPATRIKISESLTGRRGLTLNLSEEERLRRRQRMRDRNMGNPPLNKGIPHSDSTKEKMKMAWVKRRERATNLLKIGTCSNGTV